MRGKEIPVIDLDSIDSPQKVNLLVAFTELAGYPRYAGKITDTARLAVASAYYEFIGDIVEKADGKVVKFVGDATLIVFPEDRINEGAMALKALEDSGNRWLEKKGVQARHCIGAHFGPVLCGLMGTRSEKRFDVHGKTVDTAASLRSDGLAVSTELFMKLKPRIRKYFKKYVKCIDKIDLADKKDEPWNT